MVWAAGWWRWWRVGGLVGWLAGWLVWLVGWLVGWLAGWVRIIGFDTRFTYIALRRSCIRTNHISKKLWRPAGKIEELPRMRLRMPCQAQLRAFMSSLLSLLRGFGCFRSKASFCIVVSKSRLEQLLGMQSKFERKWISTSFEYQAKSMPKSIKNRCKID